MDKFKPVTHVIFDSDGLLLDTETLYFQLDSQVCASYGKEFTKAIKQKVMGTTELHGLLVDTETLYYKLDSQVCASYGKEFTKVIKQKVMGTTELRSAEIIVNELNIPATPEEYLKQLKALAEETIKKDGVDLMPGAEKLILHLHQSNVPFAIATGASLEISQLKMEKYDKLFSLVDHITAASSDPAVKHGKPAPDVFLVCAERFKDQPDSSKCLVFEDAPGGVTAAIRAGMQVVWVPNQDHISGDSNQEATLVLKSLEDFNPELFGLPAYSETKG